MEIILQSSCIRLLVVEDYDPFQRLIESVLGNSPDVQIMDVVSDGLEAIQTASKLKPDVLLIDVGLPTTNGFEAARGILESAPQCKIIFVTQHLSADLVREAFKSGARGYIAKTDIVRELLPGIRAVLAGDPYISSGLGINDSEFEAEPKRPLTTRSPNVVALQAREQDAQMRRGHTLHVYSDEEDILSISASLVGTAVSSGQSVLVIGRQSLRRRLIPTLRSAGLELGRLVEGCNYVSLDADDTASRFMAGGRPSSDRFRGMFGELIETLIRAAKCTDSPKLTVISQYTAVVRAARPPRGTIQVEELWNELARCYDAYIVCAYPISMFRGGEDVEELKAICERHSAVFST